MSNMDTAIYLKVPYFCILKKENTNYKPHSANH